VTASASLTGSPEEYGYGAAMGVTVGTAPDSWGVWFPDDPDQPPWEQFLDEVVLAGYDTIEIGPHGYLPADAARLNAELEHRALHVSAGFVMPDIHRPESWPGIREDVARVGELLSAIGARYLVLIPNVYSDLFTGERIAPAELDADSWKKLIEGTHMIADLARAEFELNVVFHAHAETPVEYEHQIRRFLEDTDADRVSLCLDMGHHAYRGGDVVDFIRRHHDRIGYLHIKSVDARMRERVEREGIPFAKAVAMDVFVEPEHGVLDFHAVRDVLAEVGYDGYGIVEQDLYPSPFDRPLPIARRTRAYLRDVGIG
jgi:inosose dehydratase